MKTKKLNEFLPAPPSPGIFQTLQTLEIETPWRLSDISGLQLDTLFFYRHGERICSPLSMSFNTDDNGHIPSTDLPGLARLVYAINSKNWTHLWGSYVAEYNPIENYSMVETENGGETDSFGHVNTRSNNLTHGVNLTEELTPGTTVKTSNDIYGFNSENGVASDDSTVSAISGKDVKTNNGTESDTGTQTDTESGSNTKTHNRRLTRAGNIGVMTPAQMIESERNLWVWNYFDTVFADVCKYLAIPIY